MFDRKRGHFKRTCYLLMSCFLFSQRVTASTFLGVDFGYQSLSVLTDLESGAMLQVDLGDAGYWGGIAVGADYLKLYKRQKTSIYDPEVFYGFGGMLASSDRDGVGVGLRFPFGVLWNLQNTPLQVGISAVPIFAVSDSYSRIRIALGIPFRWRLD